MKFEETKEQRELRRMLRSFLATNASIDAVRDAAELDHGFAADTWSKLVTELELTATAIDVEHDGVGASFADLAIALEELGGALLPVPFLSTVVAAAAISDAAEGAARERLLRAIVDGSAVALSATAAALSIDGLADEQVVHGTLPYVIGAEAAATLLLAGDDGLFAVGLEHASVSVVQRPTLDQTRPLATVTLSGAPTERLGGADAAAVARDLLLVAVAAEAIGGAQHCLDETVEYLKQRQQFGRSVGSFQALKHRCAELLVLIERARATTAYAAWAVDSARAELRVLAPMALALSSEAYMRTAAESIQLRGGIGFTWDNDAHLYFKRAKSIQLLYGLGPDLRAEAAARAGVI